MKQGRKKNLIKQHDFPWSEEIQDVMTNKANEKDISMRNQEQW